MPVGGRGGGICGCARPGTLQTAVHNVAPGVASQRPYLPVVACVCACVVLMGHCSVRAGCRVRLPCHAPCRRVVLPPAAAWAVAPTPCSALPAAVTHSAWRFHHLRPVVGDVEAPYSAPCCLGFRVRGALVHRKWPKLHPPLHANSPAQHARILGHFSAHAHPQLAPQCARVCCVCNSRIETTHGAVHPPLFTENALAAAGRTRSRLSPVAAFRLQILCRHSTLAALH